MQTLEINKIIQMKIITYHLAIQFVENVINKAKIILIFS